MTPEERLQRLAGEVVLGRTRLYDSASGACLRVVREGVQLALSISYDAFYALVTDTVEENNTGVPWARDAQRSLRNRGCLVSFEDRGPGMLAFNSRLAWPKGHVAIIVAIHEGRTLILENTSTTRGIALTGKNRLSYLEDWPFFSSAVEIMRLPWATTVEEVVS